MATNPTGQNIVNQALTILGILEQGGTPSTSDSDDALTELNVMWDAWSVDEGLIYAFITERFPLSQNIGIYTIGPGALLNVELPARIYKGRFTIATAGAIATSQISIDGGGAGYVVNDTGVVLGAQGSQATYTVNSVGASGAVLTYTISAGGTGYVPGYGYGTQTGGGQPGAGTGLELDILTVTSGGTHRTELDIVSGDRYYAHRDLLASALVPDEVYPNYDPDANGFGRIHLFPVPNGSAAMTLELEMGVNFATWSLTAQYNIPAGVQDAIQYALAFRLIPRFGAAVDPAIVQVVTGLGEKAEARMRDMVAKNRQIPAQAVQPAGAQPTPAGGQ